MTNAPGKEPTMTNTDQTMIATPAMIAREAAANCGQCEADSIDWANRGGDWFYRAEMRTDLHRRRVALGAPFHAS